MMKVKKKLTPLAKRRRRRRRIKTLLILSVIVLAGLGGYYAVEECRIEKMVIRGNETYTPAEIEKEIRQFEYVPNSLVMTLYNRIFRFPYLPFVGKMTMSMNPRKPHILQVKVKEKARPGVFEFENRFYYFDEDGNIMESRNTLFENVPIVTGVQFTEAKIGRRIRTHGDYAESIIDIVRGIRNYKLEVSKIQFANEKSITLDCGKFQVYLGSTASLDEKMSKIPAILESVSEEHGSGTIDMHLYTEDKEYITFRK